MGGNDEENGEMVRDGRDDGVKQKISGGGGGEYLKGR